MEQQESFPDAPPNEDVKLDLALPMPLQRILQIVIVLGLPVFLVLLSVRLVMTEQFLQLEYNRPGFPADDFGFTTEDRLEYGPYGVNYLVNNEPLSYLGLLEIDGQPAFNGRELEHMEDVQVVTNTALQVMMIVGAMVIGAVILLARRPSSRQNLMQALRWGGFVTFGVMLVGIALTVVAWGFFFETFHEIFFSDGTWQFSRSDTLIRLYPEQFWFDAAVSIGVLTILGASLSIAIPWYWNRQHRKQADE